MRVARRHRRSARPGPARARVARRERRDELRSARMVGELALEHDEGAFERAGLVEARGDQRRPDARGRWRASARPRTTSSRLSARGARRRRTAALGPGPASATAQASRSEPRRGVAGRVRAGAVGRHRSVRLPHRRRGAALRTGERVSLPSRHPTRRADDARGNRHAARRRTWDVRPAGSAPPERRRRLVRAAAAAPHVAGGDPPPRVDEPLPLGLGGLPARQLGLHGVGDLRPGHAVGAQLADEVALVVVGEPAHLVDQRVPGRGGVAGERARPLRCLRWSSSAWGDAVPGDRRVHALQPAPRLVVLHGVSESLTRTIVAESTTTRRPEPGESSRLGRASRDVSAAPSGRLAVCENGDSPLSGGGDVGHPDDRHALLVGRGEVDLGGDRPVAVARGVVEDLPDEPALAAPR